MVNSKSVFHLNEDIYVLAEINEVSVDHRFKIEVYHDSIFWWANADESTSFTDVEGVWGQSYDTLSQLAEEEGIFTFKVYLDIGQGYQFLEQKEVEVIP